MNKVMTDSYARPPFDIGLRRAISGREPWPNAELACPGCYSWWRAGWLVSLLRRSLSPTVELPNALRAVANKAGACPAGQAPGQLDTRPDVTWALVQSWLLAPPSITYFADNLRLVLTAFTFARSKGELIYPLEEESNSLFLPFLVAPGQFPQETGGCPICARFLKIEHASFDELWYRLSRLTFIVANPTFQEVCALIIHRLSGRPPVSSVGDSLSPMAKVLSAGHLDTDPTIIERLFAARAVLREDALLGRLTRTWEAYRTFWQDDAISGPIFEDPDEDVAFRHVLLHQQAMQFLHQTYGVVIAEAAHLDAFETNATRTRSAIAEYESDRSQTDLERDRGVTIVDEFESLVRLLRWLRKREPDVDLLKHLVELGLYTWTERGSLTVQPTERLKRLLRHAAQADPSHYPEQVRLRIRALQDDQVHRGLLGIDDPDGVAISAIQQINERVQYLIAEQLTHTRVTPQQPEEPDPEVRPFPYTRLALELGRANVPISELAIPLNIPTYLDSGDTTRAYYFADVQMSDFAGGQADDLINHHAQLASQLGFMILQPLYEKLAGEARLSAYARGAAHGFKNALLLPPLSPRSCIYPCP